MQIINSYAELPRPIQVMVVNFLQSDANEPEIYETTKDEYDHLAQTDTVVTQLLYWREYHKFYAVLVGDAKRKIQSQAIIHDPYYKECSIMAFYEVDETGIREWNKKYKDKALDENILEFN
jgi:hypothetical protein